MSETLIDIVPPDAAEIFDKYLTHPAHRKRIIELCDLTQQLEKLRPRDFATHSDYRLEFFRRAVQIDLKFTSMSLPGGSTLGRRIKSLVARA